VGCRIEVPGELGDLVAESIGVGGGTHETHRTMRLRDLVAARVRHVALAIVRRRLPWVGGSPDGPIACVDAVGVGVLDGGQWARRKLSIPG
jgi:hypothetical protein